jgi:CBS domain-containing protein
MKHNVISVAPDAPVSSAARLLSQYNIGALPVCSADGKLRGVLTDRDIVTRCVAVEEDPQTMPVKEIMTRAVMSISPADDLHEAVRRMSDKQVRRLPVTDSGGRIAGMVSLADIAKSNSFKMEAAEALSDITENIKKR